MQKVELNNSTLVFAEIPKGKTEYSLELKEITTDRIVYLSPFKIDFSIAKSGTEYHIEYSFSVEVELVCDRCLKKYGELIEGSNSIRIGNIETNNLTEFNIREYSGSFDIREFIEEEIIMDLPPQKICDESCKGLCETCGVDLNNTECKCN